MPEPRELQTARRRLAEAEADLASGDGLAQLIEGLGLLDDVIGTGAAGAAHTARNLASSYASRIYARVGALIVEDPQLPEPQLEHYFKVVLAFDAVTVALPPKATELKIAVVRALIERYYEGHAPQKKREILEQLARLNTTAPE